MRPSHLLSVVLLLPLLSGASCFSKKDASLVGEYGGHYVPSGEGPGHYLVPVDGITFDSTKRALTDADFAAVFPAVARMDPYRLHLRGEHAIGDESMDLLNQLRSVRLLDISGTNITFNGLKKLRIKGLKQLYISPDFTDAQTEELQKSMPSVRIWRPPRQREG